MMHMMDVMNMMMHVMHVRPSAHHSWDRDGGSWGGGLRSSTSGSARYSVLRTSVTHEADRESGGGDKALNHRNLSLLKTPMVPTWNSSIICLNPP